MRLEKMTRAQLLEALRRMLSLGADKSQGSELSSEMLLSSSQVVTELQLHQIELEMQNRDLRDAQLALVDSRNRYQMLYDSAPVSYVTLDHKGCVREVNRTAEAMLGIPREQIVGYPLLTLVKTQAPAAYERHLQRCATESGPIESELNFSVKDGEPRTMLVRSVPTLGSDAQAATYHTSFVDITERIHAQQELERLQKHEQVLRARFECLDQATLAFNDALTQGESVDFHKLIQVIVDQAARLADAEFAALGVLGDGKQPFVHWVFSGMPPGAEKAIGRPARPIGVLAEVPLSGKPLRLADLREHPAFRGFPANHVQMNSFLGVPLIFGERTFGNLYLTNKRSGPEFTDCDQCFAEMLAARAVRVLEIARLEEALRSAVRARDNILALVSHDLRNALSTIGLSVGMLQRAGAEGQPDLSQRQLDLIQTSVSQMSRLIDALLHAATIEAGTFSVMPRREETLSLVDEAVRGVEPLAMSKMIDLSLSAEPQLPAVFGDRLRIIQVLTNLLCNAVKFVPEGGQIRVRVTAEHGEVHFAVTDNGPGIAAEHLPHLFERFWKGKAESRGGIGLGLYIASGIVAAHGGRIWAESKLNVGSTFHFTLPIANAVEHGTESTAEAAHTPRGLSGRRVLIVDDEANAVSALAALLTEEGIETIEATSAEQALTRTVGRPLDLVLLDVEMPGMSGVALLRQLRRSHPRLPALIISGVEPGDESLKEPLETQSVAYLPKPLQINQLLATISQLLTGQATR
jgi:PAS domain S-box-containing protein